MAERIRPPRPSRAEYNRNWLAARRAAGFTSSDKFTPASPDLDVRLELLTRHLAKAWRRPALGATDVAEIIGCDRRLVDSITRRALAKLRKALTERRALEALHP